MTTNDLSLKDDWDAPLDRQAVTGAMRKINAQGTSQQKSRLRDLTNEISGILADLYNRHVILCHDLTFDGATQILTEGLMQRYPLMQEPIAQHEAVGFLNLVAFR